MNHPGSPEERTSRAGSGDHAGAEPRDPVEEVRALLRAAAAAAGSAMVDQVGEEALESAARSEPYQPRVVPDWAVPLVEAHSVPTLVFAPVRDEAGRVVDFVDVAANDAARRYSPQLPNLPDGHLLSVVQPQTRASGVIDLMRRAVETGRPLPPQNATALLLVHGRLRRVTAWTTVTPHRGHVVVVFDPDVSRQERVLRRLEDSGLGGWAEWDLAAGSTDWSDGLYRMFDRPTDSPLPLGDLASLVVPEDVPLLRSALGSLLGEGTASDVDVRVRLPAGERVLRFVLSGIREGEREGTIWGVRSYVRDVTQVHQVRSRLDAALREAERRRAEARAEARVTARLREALLPGHPAGTCQSAASSDGMLSALAYRPAENTADIGGDWYNVVPLPDRRILFALGDASGHGLDAVARMASLRSGLAGLAFTEQRVDVLAGWLNHMASETQPEDTASAVICRYHAGLRLLRWVSAGHPVPVLVRDGRARRLPAPPGLLLGVLPRTTYEAAELPLRQGDTILLYTDGLIERRDRDLDAGVDELLRAAEAAAHLPVQQLVDTVTDSLLPPLPEDDASLLVMRYVGED
ncbi:PP2C family protein-serine/threonine phosphatase [Streptomyces sp. NPDC058486]|uniref:PP2C family protein-serine/threonine phosphatase n=1 Tax=unclassified Streptomyces TaxID=2593676 RepID=UPI00364B733D